MIMECSFLLYPPLSSKVRFRATRSPTVRRPTCHSGLTLSRCSHSGTWSWIKLVSVPESPPLGLHDTVSFQLHRLLHVKYCAVLIFNCTEVVRISTSFSHECKSKRDGLRVPEGYVLLHRKNVHGCESLHQRIERKIDFFLVAIFRMFPQVLHAHSARQPFAGRDKE